MSWTTMRISMDTAEKLDKLKEIMGVNTRHQVIQKFLADGTTDKIQQNENRSRRNEKRIEQIEEFLLKYSGGKFSR